MAKLVVEDQDGQVRKNGDLAEVLTTAEVGGVINAEEILKDDEFVDASREK